MTCGGVTQYCIKHPKTRLFYVATIQAVGISIDHDSASGLHNIQTLIVEHGDILQIAAIGVSLGLEKPQDGDIDDFFSGLCVLSLGSEELSSLVHEGRSEQKTIEGEGMYVCPTGVIHGVITPLEVTVEYTISKCDLEDTQELIQRWYICAPSFWHPPETRLRPR